jgi:hypothetical protein
MLPNKATGNMACGLIIYIRLPVEYRIIIFTQSNIYLQLNTYRSIHIKSVQKRTVSVLNANTFPINEEIPAKKLC